MSEPVLFFGSGPVAAASLKLLAQDFTVEAVITKPRAEHHHGSVPVLELAKELGLATYEVANRHEIDELLETTAFTSRLGVLIDFGIIVSQKAIDHFPLGIVNSHFSLLPEWRGADPITFAILSGQKITGISLMLLTGGMDEGPLLAQSVYNIPPVETTPELTNHLIQLSHEALCTILPRYVSGNARPAPQESVTLASTTPSYSRKLTKADGVLDWAKPATVLEREVRAFTGWPQSRATLHGLDLIVTRAKVAQGSGTPGATTIINKQPAIFCGEQALVLERLKPAGKKEMTGEAFLAGYKKIFLD